MEMLKVLAEEFHLRPEQVENTVALLDDGKTIPFIARYRKEMTGSLDDQLLRELDNRLQYLRKLEQRKTEITSAIEAQGKLTPELAEKIQRAGTLVEAEDLYLPYRPKRKTRASMAIARGLEPLARTLMAQDAGVQPEREAAAFISPEKEVLDAAVAIQGAKDILAEEMANDADLRKQMRRFTMLSGTICSHAADENAETPYRNYYDYQEPVEKIAGHRVLALDRGERENALKVSVVLPEGRGQAIVVQKFVRNQSPCGLLVQEAAEDAFQRLLFPAVEREVRRELTEKADTAAIPGIRQEPAPASDAAAHRGADGAWLGPGLPDRLQAGSGGRDRKGAGHRRCPYHPRRRKGHGAGQAPHAPDDDSAPRDCRCHRKRHSVPGGRGSGLRAAESAAPSGSVYGGV